MWGPNSKGKTSLAEAVEFLLTGRIARRELMASSQDEFADALRNAHLPSGQQVYIAANVIATDGSSHQVKRILTADYAKKQDCQSRLEIDGKLAAEAGLAALGIALSQPPLEAPVLAQHTLSYIFSVRPQDRATYFKALLEVTDLDDIRNDIATLASELTPPQDQILVKFDATLAVPALKSALSALATAVPDLATFIAKLDAAAHSLILGTGEEPPATAGERLAAVERILNDRRSKTFPVKAFDHVRLPGWNEPAAPTWVILDTYLSEREKIDEATRQLVALFDEALKLPAISTTTDPIDCPLCATDTGLTTERIRTIRAHVENAGDFKKAETAARSTLAQLSTAASSLAAAADAALPHFLKQPGAKRREMGFTTARLQLLLGERAEELLRPWLIRLRHLARASVLTGRKAQATKALVESQASAMSTALSPSTLRTAFADLSTTRTTFAAAIDAYEIPDEALRAALNELLDAQSDTTGWQDFLDVARQPSALRSALIERKARATVQKELDAALKQIDAAKEAVLDDKFADYSTLIQAWWERLRPDEPTFFSAVQPRKGAKRTIDFKAGLSPNPDRSAPKMRDVIAIFSQSQLHCLGLALFLARAQHEGAGFVVLDDPVLSSDEDYRVHFNTAVLTELLTLPVQVIVITQDHQTWKDLEIRYRHLGIANAQLFIDNPTAGTVIENTSDALLAKISRGTSLARGGHPDSRKECGIQLRDAGERFCKEMLVSERHVKGEAVAAIADYDGKVLEWLCPRVEPLLVRDPSHPGKLEAFKNAVNRACHDNAPPSTGEMTQACGEIRYLVKEYLGR